ncbi:MAG: Gfo/Idh/MocA family oxidoreductase [Bryobacteraceae bacterium]|nr:Gfo/Idh/MocA family oxidoreductase [Bryobacteraceae bacterium]
MASVEGISRRGFLAASGAAALNASNYSRIIGANERILIGVIGCGGMATGHMTSIKRRMLETDNVQMIAVCDLYDRRLNAAAELTGGRPYKRYEELLANKDIDYVLNATPEHWHSRIIIDAIDAGKHLYSEKPMTRTVEQAKKVVAKVQANPKVKVQIGVQGMSDDSYAAANKVIKDGGLGRVVLAQIDYSRNHTGDFWADPSYKIDEDVQPGVNLDWKTWLGDTPKRAYDPERFFRWRRYWDYSGGIASDLFVHRVTRLIRAIGLTFPDKGVGAGGKWEFRESKAEIPDTFNILLDYPEGLTIQLVSSMANGRKVDHLIRGHKATLEFTNIGFTVTPEPIFKTELKELAHKRSGAEDVVLHHRNLQNAIRKNEPLNCDVNLGYYGVVASEMGVQSFRQQKYMKWDISKQRIVRA